MGHKSPSMIPPMPVLIASGFLAAGIAAFMGRGFLSTWFEQRAANSAEREHVRMREHEKMRKSSNWLREPTDAPVLDLSAIGEPDTDRCDMLKARELLTSRGFEPSEPYIFDQRDGSYTFTREKTNGTKSSITFAYADYLIEHVVLSVQLAGPASATRHADVWNRIVSDVEGLYPNAAQSFEIAFRSLNAERGHTTTSTVGSANDASGWNISLLERRQDTHNPEALFEIVAIKKPRETGP